MSDVIRCGSCRLFVRSENQPKHGICTRLPPVVILVPHQDILSGKNQMVPASMYPNLHEDFMSCAEYAAVLDS